jgi:uncharacterized protein YecE (DUF72 family)
LIIVCIDGQRIKTVVWPEIYFDGRVQSKIHIGTSGWSYKHWRGLFYLHKLATSKWLNYIIPGSFPLLKSYWLRTQEAAIKWAETVPENFPFCQKTSRYLTHMKKLRNPEEPLERFFSVFEVMKKKMGPVLIQLPAMLKLNYEEAEHFYYLLQKKYKGTIL